MPDTLTDFFVKHLKPSEKEYTRREKGGFGVRVHPAGRKTFFYLYRVDGQRRFLNLGDYPTTSLKKAREDYEDARVKVKALKAGRPDGIDPLELKKEKSLERQEHRNAITVCDLVQEYIQKHAMKFKKSWQEDERILNKEVVPLWGKRKAAEISKRDVVLMLEKIMERGSPGMSNNTFQVVRKMFNFAVERDILPYSPALGIKALAPKVARERTLSVDEIKTLWASLDQAAISDEIRRALKLILVTAQRPGEVIGIHAGEIDGNWWTIPSNRSKNGKAQRVYLTETALNLIGDPIARENTEGETKYVFPSPHGKKNQPISGHALAVAVLRNLKWPLLDSKGKPLFQKDGTPATENRLGVSPFTPHDLRRTAATFMAQMGCMDEVIDAVLNHSKQGVIKVYNLYRYDKEKQEALEAWERKLKSIITSKESAAVTNAPS